MANASSHPNPNMAQKLLSLQPKAIDPLKCDQKKSLYWQIIKNNQTATKRQAKQFNLGNTLKFNDPIKAAMFLLQREYGETSLFKNDTNEAVFIPPTFVSNQYSKKSSVAILDYDVKKDIERLLDNLKEHSLGHWLTVELDAFLQTQYNTDRIDKKALDKWIMNLRIMYLVTQELKIDQTNLLPTTTDLGIFVQGCITELVRRKSFGSKVLAFLRIRPNISLLESLLCDFNLNKIVRKSFKQKVISMIERNPSTDSNLLWLFGLELSELGEKVEHWFYDQLLPLKDDILQNTVVLSSVNFLTNVRNKTHREADLLIISWQRKLIISIEMKDELKNDRVFQQLDSNHQLFEERLGDQLESGWIFYPVVCVGNESVSFSSRHYITMETDIKPWLTRVLHNHPIVQISQKPTPLDQIQKLLKIIVFSIHISKKDLVAPITSTNWVDYIQNAIANVSTSDNILFYSNQQMAVMNSNDPRYNKLIIRGPFGTGKTVILQQKAMHLNKKPQYKGKVLYLVGMQRSVKSEFRSMLYHRMKLDLEENCGIVVMEINYVAGEEEEDIQRDQILQKIAQHDIKAVFCDEIDMFDSELFKKMLKIVHSLWIVPMTEGLHFGHFEEWEDIFTFLDLSQNFRNAREIVKTTKFYAEERRYDYKEGIIMPPANFPTGCTPIFVDSFENAMKEARQRTKEGILVILTKSGKDAGNHLIQIKEKSKMYQDGQNDFKKEENPYKFLQEGNVLVVKASDVNGFEWSTVIVMEREQIYQGASIHECNLMMRCTTNLIVIRKT
ncbi:uncharacterized protein [Clytia hemisphaerica]|uniref:AAA+ ATPase domain-containing protein n=1 Tax=Clytia hemisphaerica TaxID=252671 RepID=A0A7M5XH46_9CNID